MVIYQSILKRKIEENIFKKAHEIIFVKNTRKRPADGATGSDFI
jgi:hypothetical protein